MTARGFPGPSDVPPFGAVRSFSCRRVFISDNAKVLFLDAFDAQSDKAMKAQVLFPFICLFLGEYPVGAVARPL